MLFLVQIDVRLPPDTGPELRQELLSREQAYAREQQRSGRWRHLWRVVGRTANASIFDVQTAEELHEILAGLPLFAYMTVAVTPLATHPAAINP